MKIKGMRRALTVVAAVLALGIVAMPGPVDAENYRFKIASGHNENWHFIQLGRDFFIPEVKKRVAERTPHKADFLQGWASSIVKATEVLEGTQSGVIDFGLFCICHEGGKLALHNFPYYLPFGPTDPSISVKATRKVYDQIPEINQQLEKNYNQKMIALIPFDVYDVISKFPFKKADAVKGHKIGGAGPNLPWIGRMGASPVSVTGPEVYTALQTGLFDALIAFVSIMDALKLYPVAPYYVQVGFGSMTIVGLTMNLNSFNKLPKEVQDIIVEVGRETETRSGPFTAGVYDKYINIIGSKGATVIKLPEAERQAWARALSTWPSERAAQIEAQSKVPMKKVLNAYIKAAEDEGYVWPVRYQID